jgi:hypothetical protein
MMCDEQVVNLQKIQQPLSTGVPEIMLQRVEEILPSPNEMLVSSYSYGYGEECNQSSWLLYLQDQ